MKKNMTILALIFLLILLFSACGVNKQGETDLNVAGHLSIEGLKISPEEAFDIFHAEYPKAKIKEMELKKGGNNYVYEVEGYDGKMEYEVKIDPFDGKILKIDTDYGNKSTEEISRDDLEVIEPLTKKAIEDAKGSFRFYEWSMEIDKNVKVFEVEVIDDNNRKIEYKYNIKTGEMIKKDT